MSIQTEQDEAVSVASSESQLAKLTSSQFEEIRTYLLSDSYAFTKVICGHKDLIPEFHAPISYLVCGLPEKLAWTLDNPAYDSYVTRAIRKELYRRGINWHTKEGMARLSSLLDFVNIRVYRGSFKSSVATHGGSLFLATRDPNETIWVVSNSDDNAQAFCEQIRATVQENPLYAALFPERIPPNPKESLTQRHITLAGRTISHPQAAIEADGYLTKRVSAHFSTFMIDDLVVRENASPIMLRGVKAWLAGLTGFEMATRRIRRVHVGTIWDEDDDNRFLTSGKLSTECLTVTIPIETYDKGTPENITVRGTPTNPKLHPTIKIQRLQEKTISDDAEGFTSWRCNYLLDAGAIGGRMFAPSVVQDPERQYLKLDHPKQEGRFLVNRPLRDNGELVEVKDWKGDDESPNRWKRITLDPMKDLDRVFTIDPSWSMGGDNWAVTCTGDDHNQVRYQLETHSGTDGVDGWIEAVCEMAVWWRPRIIGFDNNAMQDAMVKQILKTDSRLKRIRHLFIGVPAKGATKISRIRNFVAEPLKMYRLLRDPDDGTTANEMIGYKGDKNAVDGILDTLAMSAAVHIKRDSIEERQQKVARLQLRNRQLDAGLDPFTGTPYAA